MGRVIGGETATPHEFPWMVYLAIQPRGQDIEEGDRMTSLCGATVINDLMILTAYGLRMNCVTFK